MRRVRFPVTGAKPSSGNGEDCPVFAMDERAEEPCPVQVIQQKNPPCVQLPNDVEGSTNRQSQGIGQFHLLVLIAGSATISSDFQQLGGFPTAIFFSPPLQRSPLSPRITHQKYFFIDLKTAPLLDTSIFFKQIKYLAQ